MDYFAEAEIQVLLDDFILTRWYLGDSHSNKYVQFDI